jgi:hypothetical protein
MGKESAQLIITECGTRRYHWSLKQCHIVLDFVLLFILLLRSVESGKVASAPKHNVQRCENEPL